MLVVVVFAGTIGTSSAGDDDTTTTTSVVADTPAADVGTSTTDQYVVAGLTTPATEVPVTSTTTPATNKSVLDRPLLMGTFGDDVTALQTRLTELGFAPGVADGAFGSQTQQAVWAFEKLVLKVPRQDATGKVTNEMWQGMQDSFAVQPRRPGSGTHVEIYLPEQVAAVFTDNVATVIAHISSGTAMTRERTKENSWCQTVTLDTDEKGNRLDPPQTKPVCGVSYTPGGVFRLKRQVTGDRVGALGRMFNPVYFNYGIALHGAKEIPLHPASHGCIRMHQTISNTFQSFVNLQDVVYVWGQDGREPEAYSKTESTPVFNYPDPDAPTTTTSTTTTTMVKATTTTAQATVATSSPTTAAAPVAATTTAPESPPTTAPAATAPPTTSPTSAPPMTSVGA